MNSTNHVVCLDPGHGPGCVNGSPDGSYREFEFTWDMSQRVKNHLERCGIHTIMTKEEGGYPSLTQRCKISNQAQDDLFVSFHSNASGIGWTPPRGLLIYTSQGPEGAARNKAARAVLARISAAGVLIKDGGLLHNDTYAVLIRTNAPAILVEYGFHTNRADVPLLLNPEYRAKLAEATARGVCDYLAAEWKPEAAGSPAALPDAVDKLADWMGSHGVRLNNPGYWKQGENYSDANVVALIQKIASIL